MTTTFEVALWMLVAVFGTVGVLALAFAVMAWWYDRRDDHSR